MRVLMLNPPYGKDFVRSARWAAKSRGRVQRHPDYMLIAAAVLEEAGHSVKFIDGAALNLEEKQIIAEITDFDPQMAVIHTTTPSIYNDLHYAALCKKNSDASTIMIGAHVSAEVDDTFRIGNEIENGAVDIIARGEYDYTLRDLANDVLWENVLGISYLKNGKVVHNADRPLLDVNELPFPAWHHIEPEWYPAGSKRLPFLTLISGRGCFGQCTFCREAAVMGRRRLRMRDSKLVVDEIEYDYDLFPQLKEIMFETDTFTASPSHVRGVCEEIFKRDLKITWSCNARVDIDLDLLPLMKEAGCRMLMVGFEFGTQEALDSVKKGTTPEQAKAFAARARELGFVIHGCFMFGRPGETVETARETIEFAKDLPLDTVQFSGITVYPGTELYEWARKNDYIVPKDWREWLDEDHEQATVLSYPSFTKKDIDHYIDVGLKEFYLRPQQILRMVWEIKSWGDLKMKLHGLKSFLDYFSFTEEE